MLAYPTIAPRPVRSSLLPSFGEALSDHLVLSPGWNKSVNLTAETQLSLVGPRVVHQAFQGQWALKIHGKGGMSLRLTVLWAI